MHTISALELYYSIKELQKTLHSKIDKIYAKDDLFILQVHNASIGKYLINYISPSLFFGSTSKAYIDQSDHFALQLRKHIGGMRIRAIKQVAFERIVKIDLEGKEKRILYFELVNPGNIVLCDEHNMIIIAQKYKGFGTRLIRARKSYEFPPLRKDPRIVNKFSGTYTKELVKVLASDFGLGGLFAEEVLQRSNIDKNKKIISKEESDRLIKAINSLFVPEQKIYIYKKDSVVAVLPLSLHDTQLSCLITDNWSSYFEENCLPKASAQKAKKQNKLEQLEQIQQQQIAKINGLTLAIKENTDKAHLIYTYYSELAHLMKNKVGKIDSKEQSIIITLEDKK